MAFGTKISELPAATSLTGLELIVVVQGGETRRSTVEAMEASVSQRVDVVSALASANAAAVVSTNAVVGALELRVSAVSAQASVLGAALTSTNAVVSALDTRVGLVSALTSVNAAAITSVNAVVSTKVFRNGDYMDNVQYIEFDTSTTVAASVGRLSWNIDDGTLNLGLIGGNVVNQIGQELVQRCYNNTGAPITEGSVVKVVGATGQRLTIELAQANNDANSLTVIGVATETIADKALGYVATEGFVRSIDTQGFADGDVLWLSPTTPGALTNVKPVAPQHMVMIGYVVKGGSVGAGSIFVKVQNGYELGELHDVKVSASTSLSNNEVLAYNASAGVWTNSTLLIDVQNSVSALTDRVALVSAATSVNAATVAALELRVSAVSARASTNAAAIASINNVVSALELRVSAVSARTSVNAAAITSINNVVSALELRVSAVSARASANAAAITSSNNVVSALEIRVSTASAAITSINNAVSALELRVSSVSTAVSALQQQVAALDVSAVNIRLDTVSAATSINAAAITSVNNAVAALELRVSAVSTRASANAAAITSTNNVVSVLELRVSAVSARASANAAAITSINNVVSALEIRVSAVSAAATSINNVVSVLTTRVAAVSASVSALVITVVAVSSRVSVNAAAITSINAVVSLKINRAGDTMTGALVLSGDPSVSLAAATKQYVDAGDRWVTIADLAITSVAQIDVTWTNGAYRVVQAQVLSYLPTAPVSGLPYVQVRAGGTWNTGASNYANQYFAMQGTGYSTNIATTSYINLTDTVANAAGDHATTILDIDPGPGVVDGEAGFLFNTKWSGSTGRRVMWGQGAVSVGATTIDGLRFGMLGTTWAPVGRILVMGAKA